MDWNRIMEFSPFTSAASQIFIEDENGNLYTVRAAVAGEVYASSLTVQGDVVQKGDVIVQAAPKGNS